MAKQITVLADWATAANAAGNFATKPSLAKRQAGWTGGATPDVPPAPHINWLHKTAYENIGWLIDNVTYAETARFEYLSLTANPAVNFPIGGTMRFGFSPYAQGLNYYQNFVAYDGVSGFMAGGSHYNTTGPAATGFVFTSQDGGKSYILNANTALSGCSPFSTFYDSINSRFVVACALTSNQAAYKYTSDFGRTWSSSMVSPTAVVNHQDSFFWPQAGRYYIVSTSTHTWNYSASSTIGSSFSGNVSQTANDVNRRRPVWNSRYMMWLSAPNSGTALALYHVPIASAGFGSFAGMRTLTNSTPLNMPNNIGQALFHLPHNDTFVIATTGAFLVLDGATGVPSTVANWTVVVPSTGMPKGNISFPLFEWLYYDTKRSLFYCYESGLFSSPSLAGPWQQLPALEAAPNVGGCFFKVLSSSYITEYLHIFNMTNVLSSVAGTLDAALLTTARRSFPPFF